eukprot:scaffold24026_cov39-Phaeocystis_antarctica.AAC.1
MVPRRFVHVREPSGAVGTVTRARDHRRGRTLGQVGQNPDTACINRVQGVGRGRRRRIQPESTARPWRTPQSVSWTSKSRALKVKWGGVLTCQSYPKTAEKSARSQILRSCWGALATVAR